MAERRISYAPDVENGDHPRNAPDVNDSTTPLDEYTALNRYISTARDRRRGSTSSAGEVYDNGKVKGKPWWAFWRSAGDGMSGDGTFVAPDDWVDTDIRSGLKSTDIEPRRKKTGWNELVTEKTNLFVQFIGYFRGPILYGS
jgi:H+-transporting ATPase